MPKNEEGKTVENTQKKLKKGFTTGTGRRKTAVARVFLWEEKGSIAINDMGVDEYFPSEKEKVNLMKPFHLVGISHPEAKFNISIKVFGSGKAAQLDAVVHGISRALVKLDEENRTILRRAGLLTRDPRMVERKKYFLHKARKRPQYSKR